MLKKELYRTAATATGGRDGYVRTEDGVLHIWLGAPKELGGRGFGNNPEQLFAAGYAACFLSAMKAVVANNNLITTMIQPFRTTLKGFCSGGLNHGQKQGSISKKHEHSYLYSALWR